MSLRLVHCQSYFRTTISFCYGIAVFIHSANHANWVHSLKTVKSPSHPANGIDKLSIFHEVKWKHIFQGTAVDRASLLSNIDQVEARYREVGTWQRRYKINDRTQTSKHLPFFFPLSDNFLIYFPKLRRFCQAAAQAFVGRQSRTRH